MRYFRYFIVITALSFSCQKKPITEIQEVETPELVSIDSIQSILTWVFNDGKTLWDGTMPIEGHLQLNGDTLIGLNLRLSLQKLQIQTKISTQEKNVLKQSWIDETDFDIDSFPEIKLIIPYDTQTLDDSNDELKNLFLFNSSPAKILIKNEAHDVILESSLLNIDKQELSIRFKLDAKIWVDSQKRAAHSSNKYIDIRIFVVLWP
jgi:hypothetical protein